MKYQQHRCGTWPLDTSNTKLRPAQPGWDFQRSRRSERLISLQSQHAGLCSIILIGTKSFNEMPHEWSQMRPLYNFTSEFGNRLSSWCPQNVPASSARLCHSPQLGWGWPASLITTVCTAPVLQMQSGDTEPWHLWEKMYVGVLNFFFFFSYRRCW